jgi:hypothetical protein
MSEEPITPAIKDKPASPTAVGIVLAVLALFAPLGFQGFTHYEGLTLSMIAVCWELYLSPYQSYLAIANPFMLIAMMPFGFLRLAFAYQMVRFYKDKTTRRRTFALGVVSEIPFMVLFLLNLIMMLLFPFGFTFLCGPTPILLIVGILIVRLKPPPEPPEIWEEMPEEKPWWVEESTHS